MIQKKKNKLGNTVGCHNYYMGLFYTLFHAENAEFAEGFDYGILCNTIFEYSPLDDQLKKEIKKHITKLDKLESRKNNKK